MQHVHAQNGYLHFAQEQFETTLTFAVIFGFLQQQQQQQEQQQYEQQHATKNAGVVLINRATNRFVPLKRNRDRSL